MKSVSKYLSVHHIGGRGGSRAFPVLSKFEQDVINVLYEADLECVQQVKDRNQNLESKLHVLPYCVAGACKSTFINIAYDPYMSSLYENNPEYDSFYHFNFDHDYLIGEAGKVVERRRIEAVTLDHIFDLKNNHIPPPDFLSIDTEGSEYEILTGAERTLKSSVVAVVAEVEFHPFRKGQMLFGDLSKLLSDYGFVFVKFFAMDSTSPFRTQIGLRGDGFNTTTDALFFKRIDSVNDSGLTGYLMLRKLAFIAFVFNQFEYGIKSLRHSKGLFQSSMEKESVGTAYLRFLKEFDELIQNTPPIYPVTFASKYPSFIASKSRFFAANERTISRYEAGRSVVKNSLMKIASLYYLLRDIRNFLIKFIATSRKIELFLRLKTSRFNDVEKFLISYNLKSQANLLKGKRIIQTTALKRCSQYK